MGQYGASEIYRFARLAGFSPDQAVTMTAIALAESGGNAGAHNPHGEDSRGLWQINAAAHPGLGRSDLYDPLQNAKAAYEVSGGGKDVSAWTTTHGGNSAAYLDYRVQAQAAAHASGDPAGGVWTGTEGYGHRLAAGGGDPTGSGPLRTFLDSALAQDGDPYVWGAEAQTSNADPHAFDCSELVQWAAGRAGVQLPDGSWKQYLQLQQQGNTIDVDKALHTPGALLFSFSEQPTPDGGRPSQAHVAISLGDGRTIEAQSPETGVGTHQAGGRFQYAAVLPGISDGSAIGHGVIGTGAIGHGPMALAGTGLDTDHDGLTDALEAKLGLSATLADSDHDHISDGYELLELKTNAGVADSDHDGLLDSLELALGTNPLDPDSDQDGLIDGARDLPDGGIADRDHDGISDRLEKVLGTNPFSADSDSDGFVDGAEYRSSFDPTVATSNPLAGAPSPLPGASPTTAPLPGTDPTADALSPIGHAASSLSRTAALPPAPDTSWGLDLDLGHG